ncbi:uncharacterized protein LOC144579583 [Callithrix jacchus]
MGGVKIAPPRVAETAPPPSRRAPGRTPCYPPGLQEGASQASCNLSVTMRGRRGNQAFSLGEGKGTRVPAIFLVGEKKSRVPAEMEAKETNLTPFGRIRGVSLPTQRVVYTGEQNGEFRKTHDDRTGSIESLQQHPEIDLPHPPSPLTNENTETQKD